MDSSTIQFQVHKSYFKDFCIWRQRHNSKHSCLVQEVALIGMLAYLSYLCGDWLGLSGIVALFCCAVTISHYALHNVSSLSRVTTVSAFQTLSYVSEGAIFIYVGMDTLDPVKWQVSFPSYLPKPLLLHVSATINSATSIVSSYAKEHLHLCVLFPA